MKVLHVVTTINRGGAENHLAELVRGQVAQGLQVAVAYLKGDGYWAANLRDLGVRVEALGLARYGELAPVLQLRGLIRQWKSDIVHAHMPPAELYTRIALMFMRNAPAMVISKHNDEPFYRGPGQRVMGVWVARRAKRMIAISEAVKTYACSHLNMSSDRVVTVHYGIDARPYEEADSSRHALRTEWNIPPEAWVIGTVARLVPQKALHILLRAYAQYRQKALHISRLVLVGRGPLEGELKALAHQLGLEDQIVWAGFREDIPAVMNAFDTFALTSNYEGFGLVLLEAMAAGRPVVATAVSAIPEIVADGLTGLLCPSGDADSLAQAFLHMEDSCLRARMGGAGHERAIHSFTLESMTKATLAMYQECLIEA